MSGSIPEFHSERCAREADAALRAACQIEEAARKCAVLWFADILRRGLFRELGYSSMQQYAKVALYFSASKTSDFMHLSRKLEKLPRIREALPDIGSAKARDIVRVASPKTEEEWVNKARICNRRELKEKVKKALKRSCKKPAAELFAEKEPIAKLAAEVPVRVGLELSPEQHARWQVLWEKLNRRGVTGSREEVLLEALACKLDELIGDTATDSTDSANRSALPPVQIHVHECTACGAVETGGRRLGRADAERVRCDAAVSTLNGRNTTTIPPRTRFLEVHHLKPRSNGGTNAPTNLITLCSACHHLWHERHARE